jgi:hypothetical protein
MAAMAKSKVSAPRGKVTRAQILERIEREKVKFMRLQFTDILGAIKNVEIPDRQFEEALDGTSCSTVVDRRLRPHRRIRHVSAPRPVDVLCLPVGRTSGETRRSHDLRYLHARRHTIRRLSADDAQARYRFGGVEGDFR